MTRKYEYNKANLITGVTNTNNKNVKTSYRYSYYPDGNIAHYVNHYNATMDYTYDSANRVVKEVYGEDANMPFTIGYTYDEFGNLSKKDYRDDDNPAYVTTYSYDKNNRLTKESQIVSNGSTKWQNITTYGYDKNGNRLNRVEYKNKNVDSNKFNLGMIDVGSNSKGTGYKYSDYGKEVYTYDGLNELKSYRGKNEQNATYEYMPNHYRISKTVDGTKTYQLWDNDRVVSEFDSELNMKINYRIGTNGQVLSDSKENLYSYDGHGNLVNAKSSYSTCVYDAYGNRIEDFGIGDAPFGYCGEYTDKESGLVYLRNRYYDSSTGSFITEDPIKDGNNWYGYCIGNPVNYSDNDGLAPRLQREIALEIKSILSAYNFTKRTTESKGKNIYDMCKGIADNFNINNVKLSAGVDFKQFVVWWKPDSFQSNLGYCDSYDDMASVLHMDIDNRTFDFNYGEKDYRLELWKGNYVVEAGIAGGEVGFYCKTGNTSFYTSGDISTYLNIKLVIKTPMGRFVCDTSYTWWKTGFQIGNTALPYEIKLYAEVQFKDKGMAEAFKQSYESKNPKDKRGVSIGDNSKPNTINIIWDADSKSVN